MRGCPGSPLRASAVKDEARRSGGTKHEGMKKIIKSILRRIGVSFRPELT